MVLKQIDRALSSKNVCGSSQGESETGEDKCQNIKSQVCSPCHDPQCCKVSPLIHIYKLQNTHRRQHHGSDTERMTEDEMVA